MLAVVTTVAVAVLLGGGTAAGQVKIVEVTMSPSTAVAGIPSATLTFRVPNEANTAGTVGFTVALPVDHPFAQVAVQPVSGWTATTKSATLPVPFTEGGMTISQAVTSVTWTVAPGVQIGPGRSAEFALSAGPIPAVDSLQFPATQTYDNGTVISWTDPVPASLQAPLHPVPTLTLTPATAGPPSSGGVESTPVILTASGIVVVVAVVLSGGLAVHRRRSRSDTD